MLDNTDVLSGKSSKCLKSINFFIKLFFRYGHYLFFLFFSHVGLISNYFFSAHTSQAQYNGTCSSSTKRGENSSDALCKLQASICMHCIYSSYFHVLSSDFFV